MIWHRSLNRVQLIGNLTRDPELRYTPQGTAVCTIGLATNRYWTTDSGEKHEETEFHRIVAWNKLAELCSQFLVKGRKIYVEGRLSPELDRTRRSAKSTTEVVIDDMILLDSKGAGTPASVSQDEPKMMPKPAQKKRRKKRSQKRKPSKKKAEPAHSTSSGQAQDDVPTPGEDMVPPDDIPF